MITLKFYGLLKKLCGKQHNIAKPVGLKELLSYITVNFPQTKKYLHVESKHLVAFILNGISVPFEKLKSTYLFKNDELKVLLVSEGCGKNWQTIVGVILIIVGYILYEFGGEILVQAGWDLTAAEGAAMVAPYAAFAVGMGASLLASGLMMAQISPSNYDNQMKEVALKKSYGWGGTALNLTKSGNPVPLGYGTMRVGSQVISGGLRAENI